MTTLVPPETFSVFVTDAPALPGSPLSSDFIPVTRNGATYSAPAATRVNVGNCTSVTGNYTVLATDGYLRCDCTSGNIAITLLPINQAPNAVLYIKKIDSSTNTITVSGDHNIDGQASVVIGTQYQAIAIIPNIVENPKSWDML